MTDKGTCQKHGEFILTEGCLQCLADRRQAGITPDMDELEDGLEQEGYTLARAEELAPEITVVARPEAVFIPAPASTVLVKVKPEQDIEVQSFYDQAVKLAEYAEARDITITEDLKPATDDLSIIARVKKALEAKRKEFIQPLQDHIKEINDVFKRLMEPIEIADKTTRSKILAFQQEQERIRREQEEINRLRMEAAQKEMELKGEITESVDLVEVMPEAPTTIRTDMSMAGQTDHWKYEVVDPLLIPREYLVVDNAQLTAIAKRHHDKKPIPGVRFYNEPYIAVRTR